MPERQNYFPVNAESATMFGNGPQFKEWAIVSTADKILSIGSSSINHSKESDRCFHAERTDWQLGTMSRRWILGKPLHPFLFHSREIAFRSSE
jgi:hypothetical protein